MLFAAASILVDLIPLMVFFAIVAGIWGVLTMISTRNSKAVDRLERMSRPQSLADIEDPAPRQAEGEQVPEHHRHGQGVFLAHDAANRAGAERPQDQAVHGRVPQRRRPDGLLRSAHGVAGRVLPAVGGDLRAGPEDGLQDPAGRLLHDRASASTCRA